MNFKIIDDGNNAFFITEERFDELSDLAFKSIDATRDLKLTAEYLSQEAKDANELFVVGYIIGKSEVFFSQKNQ